MTQQSRPRVLTGLRANNDLTIANYLGALLPMIDMAKNRANDYDVNLFIPDLHSFTTPIDHDQLQKQIMQNVKVFVAAGLPIDHQNVYLYRQSYVPAHSELTWILDCFTGFGEMRRMTQFKEKSGVQGKELSEMLESMIDLSRAPRPGEVEATNEKLKAQVAQIEESRMAHVSVGLFNYPVLMAADILLYNAEYVPVGDDQTQHLEFTRDIAERMNSRFPNLFTVPKPVAEQHTFFGKDQGLRIRDLLDPTKKMSKSDETGKGVIFMSDTPQAAAKKVMAAATDNEAHVRFDWEKQPGITNLLQILALLTNRNVKEIAAEWEGKTSYGEFKQAVAKAVSDFLTDFQQRLAATNEQQIVQKLESSEAAMQKVANKTLLRAQQAVGLRPRT